MYTYMYIHAPAPVSPSKSLKKNLHEISISEVLFIAGSHKISSFRTYDGPRFRSRDFL